MVGWEAHQSLYSVKGKTYRDDGTRSSISLSPRIESVTGWMVSSHSDEAPCEAGDR